MIHLSRPAAVPEVLRGTSSKRKKAESALQDQVEHSETLKFDRLWGELPVRSALWEMQGGRCCYCERLRDEIRESDIEHFRPKAGVEGEHGYGYWWLAYEWTNLLFSCRMCNQHYKKTKFPIDGKRATKPGADLRAEKAVLLDPAVERPEDFIGFDWTHVPEQVVPYGIGSEASRGDATIKVCGLDRSEVCQERHALLGMLKRLATAMLLALEQSDERKTKKYKAEIFHETSAKRCISFVGFRRAFFKTHFLDEYIAND